MDIDVKEKFDSYPADARKLLLEIRGAIITTAAQEGVGNLIETLKWGEPSYIAKKGTKVNYSLSTLVWVSRRSLQYSLN